MSASAQGLKSTKACRKRTVSTDTAQETQSEKEVPLVSPPVPIALSAARTKQECWVSTGGPRVRYEAQQPSVACHTIDIRAMTHKLPYLSPATSAHHKTKNTYGRR